jgi:hypothetical protein
VVETFGIYVYDPVLDLKRNSVLFFRVRQMPSPNFPKRLGEKFRAIRERRGLTPDEFAPLVNATDGDEILSYEDDTADIMISVFWAYVRVAQVPMQTIWEDERDL